MAWTSPRNWNASELVTAALLNTHLKDNLLYLYQGGGASSVYGAWNSWTPTITGYTTVTLTATGSYIQVGKTVIARGAYTLNTVTTLGTATIAISLPVTASSTNMNAGITMIGQCQYRTNAGQFVTGYTAYASTTTANMFMPANGAASVNLNRWAGNIGAQVAGDYFSWTFVYEAA